MKRREKYYKILDALHCELLNECLQITVEEVGMLVFAEEEKIPPEILCRIDFLYEVIIALEGTYNYLGIRRWFLRKRIALGNESPQNILMRDWRSEDENPQKVLKLAKRLLFGQIAT